MLLEAYKSSKLLYWNIGTFSYWNNQAVGSKRCGLLNRQYEEICISDFMFEVKHPMVEQGDKL